MQPELSAKLDNLPAAPGVYIFRGEAGSYLYIGKARSLKSRVRSYFQAGVSDTRFFIARLARELHDLETVVVGSEKEAALLENTLIKTHRPRYNVKLRDDKEYLSLRLDPRATFARLEVVRRPKADKALYFGPYHSATAARRTLRLVNRHFQLRTCTDSELSARTRPCLQYQIKRCLAPCVFEVDRQAYTEQVDSVAMFLDGRHDELGAQLKRRMQETAQAQAYEQAAKYRDQLRALERVREQNRVSLVQDVDQDVFASYRQLDRVEIAVLTVRKGRMTGVHTFSLSDVQLPDDELCAHFVAEYYSPGSFIPHEVLLPVEVEAMDGLAEMLSEMAGARVTLLAPRRGPRAELVDMARQNASHSFREKTRSKEDLDAKLEALMKRLRLPKPPRRIECVDVSHTGGTDTVASVVALLDGEPDRKRYRSFHVRRVSGGDDYTAMHEVLLRRFRRGQAEEKGWELPDLLVVDGGRGQLNVALKALETLELRNLPVAALAKEKPNRMGETLVDRIYLPGQKNPIELRENHAAFRMLALARDEAHRASNALRLKLGKRSKLRSRLEEIPGVGPKTRNRLLKALGSLRAVEQADAVSLRAAGATEAQAQAIVRAFHGPPVPDSTHHSTERAQSERADLIDPSSELIETEDQAVDNAFSEGQ